MSEVASRLPICISCGLKGKAWPPSWYMPTSKETRVRLDGFWKIMASVLPRKGWKGSPAFCEAFILTASSRMSWISSGPNSARVRQSRPARGEGCVGPSCCCAGISVFLLGDGRLGFRREAERDGHQGVHGRAQGVEGGPDLGPRHGKGRGEPYGGTADE